MSTPSPYYPVEHRAARAVAEARTINETTSVLRQLANADRHLDARRGEVSASLAALLEASAGTTAVCPPRSPPVPCR